MRLGVFTPLLSQLPLEKVLAKLKALQIDTVELATGNYPGDAHCKLSMLDDASALKEFRQRLDDNGVSISALSCHGNPLHPDPGAGRDGARDKPEDRFFLPKNWECLQSLIFPAVPAIRLRQNRRTGLLVHGRLSILMF